MNSASWADELGMEWGKGQCVGWDEGLGPSPVPEMETWVSVSRQGGGRRALKGGEAAWPKVPQETRPVYAAERKTAGPRRGPEKELCKIMRDPHILSE